MSWERYQEIDGKMVDTKYISLSEEWHLENDKKFSDYIKDKSIIIVGPAQTLIDSNWGEFIDGHDIVVRFNGYRPDQDEFKSNKFTKDYGKKCHIMYVNGEQDREFGPFDTKSWSEHGLKWLNLKSEHGHTHLYRENVNVRVVGTKPRPCDSALIALIAINDLLEYKPKLISVTGMDFNQGAKLNGYKSMYVPGYEKFPERQGHSDHQFEPNKMAMRKWMIDGKIQCDDVLKDVLLDHTKGAAGI